METQFSIDDAFVLEGEDEGVSDGEKEGWKGREKDREGGEMTFGPLSFAKPQTHSPSAVAGSPDHSSSLKYQVMPHHTRTYRCNTHIEVISGCDDVWW